MQLIKIVHQPIQYEFEIERAKLQVRTADIPRVEIRQKDATLELRSSNISIRQDSTDMRASLNLRNTEDFSREYAQRGKQKAMQATGETVQMGNEMQRIDDGVTIAQLIQSKMLEQPDSVMVFLPATGSEISWDPNRLETDYREGSLEFDWDLMQNKLEYIPGKFRLKITQYPSVTIEYLGDPLYFPPSFHPGQIK